MLENAAPKIYEVSKARVPTMEELDNAIEDAVDAQEIFDIIRSINDPEHPLTLEELNVVEVKNIKIHDDCIDVEFTPTIPNCSMATLIGLCIKVKLLRSLPGRYKISVKVAEGTHMSEEALNKQLRDKERVAAALENFHLLQTVNQCLLPKSYIDMLKV